MSANVLQCFAPRIAVYETAEVADWLDSRLNLPDLAVLLKPWQSRVVERVSLRSSTYETSAAHSARNQVACCPEGMKRSIEATNTGGGKTPAARSTGRSATRRRLMGVDAQ